MNEQLKHWHPSDEEVAEIVAELRPLIRRLADSERSARLAEAPAVAALVALAVA